MAIIIYYMIVVLKERADKNARRSLACFLQKALILIFVPYLLETIQMALNNTKTNSTYLIHVQASSQEPSKVCMLQQSFTKKRNYLFLKRLFDVAASLLLIIIFLPVLIIVALLIKLTSKGSVLFVDKRVGRNGSLFNCYKFRSMVNDHTIKKDDYLAAMQKAGKGILYKYKDDGRITPVGKILRKTSIDELPQLFNVVAGNMSLVGPRPLLPFMLTPYPEFKEIRNLVKPGITGLWQVTSRQNNTNAAFMIQHDMEYIENFNFFHDIKIVVKTPFAVLSGKGAL